MRNGMTLTDSGRNLIAKCLTGKLLTFTKCQCGDGTLGNKSITGLTKLISPKRDIPIQALRWGAIGTAEIVIELTNKNVTQGFYIKEFGLYARDPDTNQEVLYSYGYTDKGGYLIEDNGIDTLNYILTLITIVDQVQNIQAVVTNTNQYVTLTRLDAKLLDLFGDYLPPAGFWTYHAQDTHRLRPATVDQVKELLLGKSNIESLEARLERLEDALSQTLLELEMQNIFPGYTHFIIEDFRVVNQIDMYTSQVKGLTTGDDWIECDESDGMIPGSWYTLTDGVRSERVQVESISLIDGKLRLILKDTVKNAYQLKNTKIYRTSVSISQKSASGPGITKSCEWTPNITWKGQSESSEFNVSLNTSLNNSGAFIFSGDAVLDSESYITLGE